MRGGHDGHLFEGGEIEVPDIEGFAIGELHPELLVKVAIKDTAFPIDADGISTHEAGDGGGVEVFDEKLIVFSELLVALEVGGVARDGHVGDAVEVVKFDVEVLLHLAFVVGLEFFLVGGEEGSVGVVDEIEFEVRLDSVAKLVELLEGGDGAVEDTVPSLLVDVVGGVARHGGDAGDVMLGVELRDPLVAGFFNDGSVEAGHDFARLVEVAHTLNETAEVGMHLGSSASKIERGDIGLFEPVDSAIEVLTGDEFFAVRTCIHVAMDASNVAKFAEVELENTRSGAGERNSIRGESLVKGVERRRSRGAHGVR